MEDVSVIYNQMRNTELNERVGGTDPEQVGQACFRIIRKYFDFNDGDNILDFGCGIGRASVPTATQSEKDVIVTGMDIMPDAIEFCNSVIQPKLINTRFQLVAGSNDHYDRFISSQNALEKESVERIYESHFNKAYAFSVFTHVDHHQFADLLRFVRATLRPDGIFLFTCFILTPFSRAMISTNAGLFNFDNPVFENGGDVFVGNSLDRLAFIAYDINLIESFVFNSGLVVSGIEYGAWRGDKFSGSLQDIVIVRNRV